MSGSSSSSTTPVVPSPLPAGLPNPYTLLAVERDASAKTIKTAYRKSARACHPDKNPDDPSAQEKFNRLTQAYEFLLDSKSRKAFDSFLAAQKVRQERYARQNAEKKKFKEELEAREAAAKDLAEKKKAQQEKWMRAYARAGRRSSEEEDECRIGGWKFFDPLQRVKRRRKSDEKSATPKAAASSISSGSCSTGRGGEGGGGASAATPQEGKDDRPAVTVPSWSTPMQADAAQTTHPRRQPTTRAPSYPTQSFSTCPPSSMSVEQFEMETLEKLFRAAEQTRLAGAPPVAYFAPTYSPATI